MRDYEFNVFLTDVFQKFIEQSLNRRSFFFEAGLL